jgi:hypothetical protein
MANHLMILQRSQATPGFPLGDVFSHRLIIVVLVLSFHVYNNLSTQQHVRTMVESAARELLVVTN